MTCPYCDSDDTYGSTLRGELHRCNGCGEYFDPDGPNDDEPDMNAGAPARKQSDADDYDEAEQQEAEQA